MEEILKYKKQVIIFSCIVGVILSFIIVFTIFSENKSNKTEKIDDIKFNKTDNYDKKIENILEFKGIMLSNIDDNKFSIYNIDMGVDYIMEVDNLTVFRNRSNKITTKERILAGDIVEVGYSNNKDKVTYISISDDFWEISDIKNFEIDETKHILKYDKKNYKFHEGYEIFSNGKSINLSEIDKGETVTIRGSEKEILSIIVKEAYGGLGIINIDKFINGKVIVDNDMTYEIRDNITYNLLEGIHEIVFVNDDKRACTEVEIKREDVTMVNIDELDIIENDYTMVNFNINPASARLYIDGKVCTERENVKMYYGRYEIVVESAGYKAFRGYLLIDSPNESLSVKLVKENKKQEDSNLDEIDDNIENNQNEENINIEENNSSSEVDESEKQNLEDSNSESNKLEENDETIENNNIE